MKKVAKSVSVIGGEDGPTTIFLGSGKEKNLFRRIQNTIWQWNHRRKREISIKQILSKEHSLEETIQFMKDKYHAYEADESYPFYSERMLQLRCSIIQMKIPELIDADVEFERPGNLEDENEFHSWMEKIDKRQDDLLRKTACITQEKYPINCHLYIITVNEGTIEIEMEDNIGLLGTSISGDIKHMKRILKDIYVYYGVSKKDIEMKTPRYESLVAELSS